MKNLYLLLCMVLFIFSCQKEEDNREFPRLITSSVLDISDEGVSITAEVSLYSERDIINHGAEYKRIGAASFDTISLGKFAGGDHFFVKIDRDLIEGAEYEVRVFAQTKKHLVYGNSVFFTSQGVKAPLIKDVYPLQAYVGDTIFVRGDYFSQKADRNSIWFGVTKTTPFFVSDTLLKTVVPTLKEAYRVEFKLEVAGKVTQYKESFALGLPVVAEVRPEVVLPGDTVEMKGKGFLQVIGVNLGDVIHPLKSMTDSTLKLVLSEAVSAGEKEITLVQLGREALQTKKIKVIYPEIKSVAPLTVWFDSIVYIRGSYLSHVENISIDGNYWSDELISKTDTLVKLKIKSVFYHGDLKGRFRNSEVVAIQKLKFNPPVITSISKDVVTYGDTVYVKGDRFFSGLQSRFGHLEYISKTELKLIVDWNVEPGIHSIPLTYYTGDYPNSGPKLTIPEIEFINVSPFEVKRGQEINISMLNLPKDPYYNIICLVEGISVSRKIEGGMIKLNLPYAFLPEYPKITILAGKQQLEIPGAIHVTEKWEKVIYSNSFSGYPLFVSAVGKVYAFVYDRNSSRIYSFDPNERKWVQELTLPGYGMMYNQLAVSDGEHLFFVCGNSQGEDIFIFKYSLADKSWTRTKGFPYGSAYEVKFAFSIEGKIYMGNKSGFCQYDVANDEWIKKANLPEADIGYVAACFSINDRGIVSIHSENTNNLIFNDLWEYNPQSDSWRKMGNMQVGDICLRGTSSVHNGKAYIITETRNSGYKLLEFDPVRYVFKELIPPNISHTNHSFVHDNYFYVLSSYDYGIAGFYRIPVSEIPNIYKD